MPKFVPVSNPELSRNEQNLNSQDNLKHRKFDNPHSLIKSKEDKSKTDRGWEQGNIGWGVLGAFGSNRKDEIAQVMRRSDGTNKMIKNERGLWVKVKEVDQVEILSNKKGSGRGGGIPVFQNQQQQEEFQTKSSNISRHSRSQIRNEFYEFVGNSNNKDETSASSSSHQWTKQNYQDERRHNYRDRSHDRDYDRDRDYYSKDRMHDKRKEDRHYDDRKREQSFRSDQDRERYHNDNRVRKRHRDDPDSDSGEFHVEQYEKSNSKNSIIEKEKDINVGIENSNDVENNSVFHFNAVQIVNHFQEIFADSKTDSKKRVEAISELFTTNITISSLKTEKLLLTGREAIFESFQRTSPSIAECSRRLFIPSVENDASAISYCLDLHTPGTSPGLGDKTKDTVILYRCDEETAKITHVWGAADPDQLASKSQLTKTDLLQATVWKWTTKIFQTIYPSFSDHQPTYFHDYTNIETI